MAVEAIAPVGSSIPVDLNQLFEVYQQQVTGMNPVDPTASNAAVSGVNGLDQSEAALAARGSDFGAMVGNGLRQVEALDTVASDKAVLAATGDLTDVHDYVIAAQKAQTAVELTTMLRNKALDSFNEIMRMPL